MLYFSPLAKYTNSRVCPHLWKTMLTFERSGLSEKLMIISVLSTGTTLLFVFVAFAAPVLGHRDEEERQLSSLAGVIGANSVQALLFMNTLQAEQTFVVRSRHPTRSHWRSCTTATASVLPAMSRPATVPTTAATPSRRRRTRTVPPRAASGAARCAYRARCIRTSTPSAVS